MTTSNDIQHKPPEVTGPEARIRLDLPSILGYEKIARGAAQGLAEQIELTPDRIEDFKTVVAEVCMNAIEHGNNFEPAADVTVVMTITPEKLDVRVTDRGRQPVPDSLPTPGGGEMRGWGMFLIKNLADEMEITRLPDGGNQVRVAIYVVPPDKNGTKESAPGQTSFPAAPAESPARAILPVGEQSVVLPAEEKTGAIQLAEDQPRAVRPAEKKPGAIQPAEEKPKAVQPAEDVPRVIQPAEDLAAPSKHSHHQAPDNTPTPES
jgi:serine/threonine-protein kinase RsbW